jgi:hypothetical protein
MKIRKAISDELAAKATTKGAPASVETDATGRGTATSKVYVGGPTDTLTERDLLLGWHLDPDEWQIQPGSLRVNRWQQRGASDYDTEIWCYQYKAAVEKVSASYTIADLEPLVGPVTVKVKTVRKKRVQTDLACAVILPDAQISYWRDEHEQWRTTHDEAALDISRQVIADVEAEHGVDVIVDLGDFLDATNFSRHRSAPSQIDRFTFKKSVARAQQELAARTALTPNAERHLIPGNHDQRINLWLTDNAPWLMGLSVDGSDPMLSLEWLLQTEVHGWQVEAAYPEGAVYLNHNTVCIHGHIAKGQPGASAAEYLKQEISTFFGHTPRAQTVYRTVARHGQTRTYVASTAGGLMKISGDVPSGFSGIKVTGDPALAKGTAWDQGLSVVFYDPKGHTVPFVETVSIFSGRAVWRGRIYEASCDADGNPLESEVAA